MRHGFPEPVAFPEAVYFLCLAGVKCGGGGTTAGVQLGSCSSAPSRPEGPLALVSTAGSWGSHQALAQILHLFSALCG